MIFRIPFFHTFWGEAAVNFQGCPMESWTIQKVAEAGDMLPY